ncbi:MAG: flavin reductase [Clostridia bacterium]|nr:flavin reductase [Clostridia bacterium]
MYKFGDLSKETLEQLSGKGAFLTVKSGDKVNTMTIGWGSLSQYWGQEIFIAPVRHSRYTFELLENADEFTVSIPVNNQLDDALKTCGSLSGRNGDKNAGITMKASKELLTPVVDGCDIYYECKILTYTDLEKDMLDKETQEKWYANNDMHRLYFGKIVAAYR